MTHPRLRRLRADYLARLSRLREITGLPAEDASRELAKLLHLELRLTYQREKRALSDRIRGGRRPSVTDNELRGMAATVPQREGWTRARWALELQRAFPPLLALDGGWLARRLVLAQAATAGTVSGDHTASMDANTLADLPDDELEARVRELRRELEPLEAEQLARAWRTPADEREEAHAG